MLTLFCFAGVATRMCDKDDGWQKPSLLECVSNSFLVLQGRVSVDIFTNSCSFVNFSFMRARVRPSAKDAEREMNSSDIHRSYFLQPPRQSLTAKYPLTDLPLIVSRVLFSVEKSNIRRCKLGARFRHWLSAEVRSCHHVFAASLR